MPPAKNGDYAYLLHVLASLKTTGKGAVILPHGVLFRGNAEADIREKIVRKSYIKGIIGLPANLFYGTGIPACIVVLDKENAHARTGIFMIDASKGFVKDGNKNRLRSQDLHKIVDAFTKQVEIDKYSRMVPLAEIEKHGFNLNIPRYIDSAEPEDLQDIEAHLKGGIPVRDVDALSDFWRVLPAIRATLFGPGNRPGYLKPLVNAAEVKGTILTHPEFVNFTARMSEVFDAWAANHIDRLRGIAIGDHPKELIATISEDLLERFKHVPLIDGYDVYQHLMTYWAEVMQDDAYILAEDGWAAGRVIRELAKTADSKFTETPDITLGRRKLKAELIPPALLVARFFATERSALDALAAEAEDAARALEELDEEHGSEDGLLFDAKTDKGKLTAKSVRDRIKDLRNEQGAEEERAMLKVCLSLIEAEADADSAVKAAQAALDAAVVEKYSALTEEELRTLLVHDKWLAQVLADIEAEVDRVSQALAVRVKVLADRYAAPMQKLANDLEALSVKVDTHLNKAILAENKRDTEHSEEWQLKRLGDFARFFKGKGLPKSAISASGKHLCIHYGELFTFYGTTIDNVSSRTDSYSGAFLSRSNDVLMPTSDVTPRGLAKASCLTIDDVILGGDTLVIRSERSRVVGSYLAAQVRYREDQVLKLVTGSTVFHLYARDMRKFQLPVPSVMEQNEIAEALSDIDAEIAALEAQAAKVRAVKQGMMQVLLTGRVRLA